MINSELAHSLVDEYRGKRIEVSDMLCLLSDYDHKSTSRRLLDLVKDQQETIQLQAENISEIVKMNKLLKEINTIQEEYTESITKLANVKVNSLKLDIKDYNLKSGLYRLFNKVTIHDYEVIDENN